MALIDLGVDPERIYTDHGLTGRTRARPGLDQALAAVRAGDTLVVTKLDRLARSVPDAREIADQLLAREVKLALGPTTHDPNDPMGKMFFNILATFAEFESDLIRTARSPRHFEPSGTTPLANMPDTSAGRSKRPEDTWARGRIEAVPEGRSHWHERKRAGDIGCAGRWRERDR